jgi:AraC-like DNA-binding protein
MTERVRLPSVLVGATLSFARARGLDVNALLRSMALPDLSPNGHAPLVTAAEARALLDRIAGELSEPLLGIHVAQSLERGTYGVVEYACRSAPNLRGSLERIVRFIALLSAPAVAELAVLPDGGRALRFRFPGVRGSLGRQGNEFFAASVWLRARELTGTTFRPTRVSFDHPAPEGRRDVETFFEVPTAAFGAEWNELGFAEHVLDLPVLSHEPHLLPILDKMAETEVQARAATRGLVDQVEAQVRGSLAQGEPALDDVARALGMSGRTLQRRLNDEERPFAEVVDSIRNELACVYVREPERSLDDVASLLGYAGSRPFQRAFKRWTGMTPLEYRRANDPKRARGQEP